MDTITYIRVREHCIIEGQKIFVWSLNICNDVIRAKCEDGRVRIITWDDLIR